MPSLSVVSTGTVVRNKVTAFGSVRVRRVGQVPLNSELDLLRLTVEIRGVRGASLRHLELGPWPCDG